MKIKLLEPGWKDYNGPLGGVEFKNGVSEEELSAREAERIACSMRVEVVDGNHFHPNPAQRMLDGNGLSVPVTQTYRKPQPERKAHSVWGSDKWVGKIYKPNYERPVVEPAVVDEPKSQAEQVAKDKAETEAEEPKTTVKRYTRNQLELIADHNGIDGLREIAEHYGVKSNSIKQLIDKIIDGQKEKSRGS